MEGRTWRRERRDDMYPKHGNCRSYSWAAKGGSGLGRNDSAVTCQPQNCATTGVTRVWPHTAP